MYRRIGVEATKLERQNVWAPNKANQPRDFYKFSYFLSLSLHKKSPLKDLFLLRYKPTSPGFFLCHDKNKALPCFLLSSSLSLFQNTSYKENQGQYLIIIINSNNNTPFGFSFAFLCRSLSLFLLVLIFKGLGMGCSRLGTFGIRFCFYFNRISY